MCEIWIEKLETACRLGVGIFGMCYNMRGRARFRSDKQCRRKMQIGRKLKKKYEGVSQKIKRESMRRPCWKISQFKALTKT